MTSIQEIVEGMYLEAQSIDSLFRNKERYLFYKYSKDALKKLNLTFSQNLKGMNFHVPISCKVQAPDDFQQFVRAYLINCDGKRIELKRATDIPDKIFHYLVDCDGSVVSGCDENELTDECIVCNDPREKPCKDCSTCKGTGRYIPCHIRNLINDLEAYKDSWVSTSNDYFEFSSDLEGLAVIIEYIGNQIGSMSECLIKVEEDFEEAIEYFVKYKLLNSGESTITQSEYYYKKFKACRDSLMSNKNAVTVDDLKRITLIR